MIMKKLTTNASRCPRGCDGYVKRLLSLEYLCKICGLRYLSDLLGSKTLAGDYVETRLQNPSPERDPSTLAYNFKLNTATQTTDADNAALPNNGHLDPQRSALTFLPFLPLGTLFRELFVSLADLAFIFNMHLFLCCQISQLTISWARFLSLQILLVKIIWSKVYRALSYPIYFQSRIEWA